MGSGWSLKGGENALLFFAGNLSTWITGAHLVVDVGGIA